MKLKYKFIMVICLVFIIATLESSYGECPLDPVANTPISVNISSDSLTINEGTQISYTVTLSRAASGSLSIPYTLGGTAKIKEDYTIRGSLAPGWIIIPFGGTEGMIILRTVSDNISESDETITLTLGGLPENYVMEGQNSITTIIKDSANQAVVNPDLKLAEVQFKNNQSKFTNEDSVVIQYKIQNSGADFTGFPTTYISVWLSEDGYFNQMVDKLLKDNIQISHFIGAGSTSNLYDLQSFKLTSDILPGNYSIFVLLNSGEQIATTKELRMELVKLFTPGDREITENFSDTSVYIGDIATGGQNSELNIKFPAYSESVDHYVAILFPDGTLKFVQQNQQLTNDYLPYADNTTEARSTTFPSSFINIQQGIWGVYWLTAPADNDGLIDIINKGRYDFQFYTLTVN
ncbi:MAG: hypothetical protein HQK63_04565 [Desulfamplus sp.]|nr:hypothetical protein [Desulfamplus sp.]